MKTASPPFDGFGAFLRGLCSQTCLVLIMLLGFSAWPSAAREIPVVTPAKAGLSEAKLAEVDRFMERAVADQKIAGGIVIVSHKGKIGFFHTTAR